MRPHECPLSARLARHCRRTVPWPHQVLARSSGLSLSRSHSDSDRRSFTTVVATCARVVASMYLSVDSSSMCLARHCSASVAISRGDRETIIRTEMSVHFEVEVYCVTTTVNAPSCRAVPPSLDPVASGCLSAVAGCGSALDTHDRASESE